MKLAVLSDIHGNDLALAAVLHEVRALGIERLFCLGDFVGYYYRPDAVLKMLEGWDAVWVQGNHEGLLKTARASPEAAAEIQARYGSGIAEALRRLNAEQQDRLVGLPESCRVSVEGMRFLLCHGAPWGRDAYVYPDADAAVLQRCAQEDVDCVLMGHTHYPFVTAVEGTLVANAGSVGQSRDHGGLASWLVVDTRARTLVFKRTPFETATLIEQARRLDPHVPYLEEVLSR
jgi:putative phosphoesterase